MVKTAYATMGLPPTCSQNEIREAYKALALKWHPDKQPNRDDTVFKEVLAAYGLIKTEEKRKLYDQTLAQTAAQNAAQNAAHRAHQQGQYQTYPGQQPDTSQQQAYGGGFWWGTAQYTAYNGHPPPGAAHGAHGAHGGYQGTYTAQNKQRWPPQPPPRQQPRQQQARYSVDPREAARQQKEAERARSEEMYRRAQEELQKQRQHKAQSQAQARAQAQAKAQAQAQAQAQAEAQARAQAEAEARAKQESIIEMRRNQAILLARRFAIVTPEGQVDFARLRVAPGDWATAARRLNEMQYASAVFELAKARGYITPWTDGGLTVDFQRLGVPMHDFAAAELALKKLAEDERAANMARQAELRAQAAAREAEAAQGAKEAAQRAKEAAEQAAQAERRAEAARAEAAREEERIRAEAAAKAEAEAKAAAAQGAQASAQARPTTARHWPDRHVYVDLTGSPEPSSVGPQSPAPSRGVSAEPETKASQDATQDATQDASQDANQGTPKNVPHSTQPEPSSQTPTPGPEAPRKRQHAEDTRPAKRQHTDNALNMDDLELPEDVPEQYRPKPATWFEQGVKNNNEKRALRDAYIKSVDYGMTASADLFQCFTALRQNVPPLAAFELPQSAEQIGAFLEQVRAPLRELSDLLDRVQAAQAP